MRREAIVLVAVGLVGVNSSYAQPSEETEYYIADILYEGTRCDSDINVEDVGLRIQGQTISNPVVLNVPTLIKHTRSVTIDRNASERTEQRSAYMIEPGDLNSVSVEVFDFLEVPELLIQFRCSDGTRCVEHTYDEFKTSANEYVSVRDTVLETEEQEAAARVDQWTARIDEVNFTYCSTRYTAQTGTRVGNALNHWFAVNGIPLGRGFDPRMFDDQD